MEGLAASNNAIYVSTATGNVYVATAGTMAVAGNAFSVGSSTLAVAGGKVGVNTSAPGNMVHIKVATNANIRFGYPSDAASSMASLNDAASAYVSLDINADPLTFGSGSGAGGDFIGRVGLYSRTIAQLQAITPTAVGQMYYCNNCSPLKAVVSTGTSAGNFADAAGGTFK